MKTDLKSSEGFVELQGIVSKIKRAHGALVYRSAELKAIFEESQKNVVASYFNEWDSGLREQIEADEQIDDGVFGSEEIDRDANNNATENSQPAPEKFKTFKSYCVTRWFSELAMIESFFQNRGKI
jgi:hypothetical protein